MPGLCNVPMCGSLGTIRDRYSTCLTIVSAKRFDIPVMFLPEARPAHCKSVAQRIGLHRRGERNGGRGLPGRALGLGARSGDQVDPAAHPFRCQHGQSSPIAVSKTLLDNAIHARGAGIVAHAFREHVLLAGADGEILLHNDQQADAPRLVGLLGEPAGSARRPAPSATTRRRVTMRSVVQHCCVSRTMRDRLSDSTVQARHAA